MRRRHNRGYRRACGDRTEPVTELRMFRPPVKIGKPRFEPEGTRERDLRHIERSAHQRMIDLPLPQVCHSLTAICFVSDNRRRLFVFRPGDLTAPHCEPVQYASRQSFETARLPSLLTGRQLEDRITVNMIEMGADDSRFFQPNAVVTDEIRHATRRINLVVRT